MPLIYPQLDGVKINPDRSLPVALIQAIRKAYDYIAQTQATVVDIVSDPNTPTGPDGTPLPPEVTGPVTGFSFVGEVGTRYADKVDRLQHLTIGFTPIMPTPQTVTYLISNDAKATWTWIGSQLLQVPTQVLRVDRLVLVDDANWAIAAVAGNQGGDPRPILNAALLLLYPDAIVSQLFPVKGLAKPLDHQGIVATIGGCANVVTSDGLTQYGRIPGVIYTDPPNSLDWVVCITVTDLDATFSPISIEKAHNYLQITGGQHELGELLVTYRPGLAYISYKFYVANRANKDPWDFPDVPSSTLQYVSYNGGALATHYEVPVTIPTFTPIDPNEVFNVLSVTASEVGPKHQDDLAGLHTVIGIVPVIDIDYTKSHYVTLWLDNGDGIPVWQGDAFAITFAGQVIRIGDATLNSAGVRNAGDIWVPSRPDRENWTVWCAAGRVGKGVNPVGYAHSSFHVISIKACSPYGITNAHFNPDPNTGSMITYSKYDPGMWFWEYFQLEWTPPNQLTEPDFWFTLITVQKGATIGGVWTPAPDYEGRDSDPYLAYLGRAHDEVTNPPGMAPDQTVIMQKNGANPATWNIPPTHLNDLVTPNIYREFRFLLYSVSRLGSDASGSGGKGTYTLQTTCWPGGTDHYILIPDSKNGDLNLTLANPASITGPLSGGAGMPITILPGAITGGYLPDDAILARHMHEDSITAANKALAASSVVDGNVNDVNVSKLIAGTNIFTGNVFLSRGIGQPIIVLQNSGINLFGQADASTGATGLISKPNVAIQSTGISLFSGAGPSTTITSSAITFWSNNGLTTSPYTTVSAGGIVISDGGVGQTGTIVPQTFSLDATGFSIADKIGAIVTVKAGIIGLKAPLPSPPWPVGTFSTAVLSGGTITLTTPLAVPAGAVSTALMDGNGLKFSTGSGATYAELKMDNSGIAISKGTSSVTITASQVNIVNGFLTTPQIIVISGTVTINIDATNYIKVTDTATNRTAMLNHNYIRIERSSDNLNYAQMIPGTVRVAGVGGTHQSFLDNTFLSIDGGLAQLNATQLTFNSVQVLARQQPGPGFPPAFTDLGIVRTWCIHLYEALSAAGNGTGSYQGGPGHGLIL